MKKIFMIAASATIGLAAFTGCSKSSSSSSYSMSATVTKSGSNSNFSTSGSSYVTAVDSAQVLYLTGVQTSGSTPVSTFDFIVTSYTGPGTYSFSGSNAIGDYYLYGSSTATTLVSGSLVITSVSGETVSGTFSGTLSDSSTVTNGKFTASGRGF